MKKLRRLGVILLAIQLFLLMNSIQFRNVSADTEVSGVITTDTTWTQENSPYIVNAPLLVNNGVTLTIESGATVYLIDAYIRVEGTLRAQGSQTNPISIIRNGTEIFQDVIDDSAIQFTPSSLGWDELTGSGSILENAIISSTQDSFTIYIDVASPKIHNCTVINTGGQRAIYFSGSPIISKCLITSNFVGITCSTSSSSTALISENVITGCNVGIEIYGGSPTVEKNIIINNSGYKTTGNGGIRIDNPGSIPIIQNNIIAGNIVGFNLIKSPNPTIKFNTIQSNNEESIYMYDESSSNIDARSNWWGTTETTSINQSIRDQKNDFNLGIVSFTPFLTEPHPDTPSMPIIVEFEYFPSVIYTNFEVQFDASESFGKYTNITSYNWEFGDDTTTTLDVPTAVQTYTTTGSHEVILTVTDEYGFTNTTSINLVVLKDDVAPVTKDNYDDLWHNTNVTITLTSNDQESGVSETYYKINDGSTQTVSIDGQPVIITEDANNTLEYWSVDKSGNEELHKKVNEIKVDSSAPFGSVQINENNDYTNLFAVSLNVFSNDTMSGVAEMRFSNDDAQWSEWETISKTKMWTLNDGDGEKTVYLQFKDNVDLISETYQDTIIVDSTSPTANAGQDRTVDVNTQVNFDARASNDNMEIVSYLWNFGDNTTGTGETTIHSYSDEGTYTVTLAITDIAENTDTHQVTITAKQSQIWIIAIVIVTIVAITAIALVLLKKRKK